MSEFEGETAIAGDSNEDEQLKIRIPNPKVYMARQSLWIGRRGKPRCDHCRLNNLKCDRVLPACNHCSWTVGRECKYTPLPTPAHRGIPRCDRCRLINLKCDRSLPVCNHCKDGNKTECNYTPKKRRKIAFDAAQESSAEHNSSWIEMNKDPSLSDSHGGINFFGQNVTSSSLSRKGENVLSSYSESSGSPPSQKVQTGRFMAKIPPSRAVTDSLSAESSGRLYSGSRRSHSYEPSYAVQIVPWNGPPFAPLPKFMISHLQSLKAAEFPGSAVFNDALVVFLQGIIPELREMSCLTHDAYISLYHYLSRGEARLSPKIREWASYHHLCSGSDAYCLILLPRETIYRSDDLEGYRRTYSSHFDDEILHRQEQVLDINPRDKMDNAELFERMPVQEQIFDILTYAHLAHENPPAMLAKIRKLGFASITWPMTELYIRLCPTCTLHKRPSGENE